MIILTVIPQPIIRKRAANKLAVLDCQIVEVTSSKDAITYLRENPVNLIITEIEIGDMDGWRLARLVRADIFETNLNTPIILLTDMHCERIAQTTARMFDISRVMSFQDIDLIGDISQLAMSNIGNLNTPPNVLVIEDTPDTANLVERILNRDFNIDIALNGEKGLQAYHEGEYKLVLLDIMMPGISGEDVLEAILKINPKQIVIMMTAHGTCDIAELMLEKGAIDYIQKPFKADQLRKICDIATKREDFLISSVQFSAKTQALSREKDRYETLSKTHYRILDSLSSVVVEVNLQGRITFLNNAWYYCTNYTISESVGRKLVDFIDIKNAQSNQYINRAYKQLITGVIEHDTNEIKLTCKNGESIWCELTLSHLKDSQGAFSGLAGTLDNIGERKKAQEALEHVAIHDPLTNLNNRFYFDEELEKITQQVKRSLGECALLYLDLDHFKIINDSHGHRQGDLVLIEVAKILKERCRASDILCRIGGDEFVYLLLNTDVRHAQVMAEQVCQSIAASSFQFNEQIYKVSCSVGITSINQNNTSPDICLQQADLAMFAAKQKGRNGTHIFSNEDKLTDELRQNFDWVQKIQHAISEDNLEIHFQPILAIATGKIECYEALVRLVVDDKLTYPNDFIPSLEKAEDMILLDRHVIAKVCEILSEHPFLNKVAINLSAQAFSDESLIPYVENKFALHNIHPNQIIFELTESDSISNLTGTKRIVHGLNQLGCEFSIDDFGTGFSTFSYLKELPSDSVKIDGSFVVNMVNDPVDAALVKAIHEAARVLNKKTVAEFVENEQTLQALKKIGVDYAQGYYINRPMDVLSLKKAFETHSAAGVA